MPAFVSFVMINSNTPQQNAGIFVGETNITGWDANMKYNTASAGIFGFFNVFLGTVHTMIDGFEMIDGIINDMDIKANLSNQM